MWSKAAAAHLCNAALHPLRALTPIDGGQLETMMRDLAVAATPEIVAAYRRLGAGKK